MARADALASSEFRALALPAVRNDYRIAETSVPPMTGLLDVTVAACGGAHDDSVAPDPIEAWREVTTGAFVSRLFPGGDFYIHEQRATVPGRAASLTAVDSQVEWSTCM